MRNRSFRFLCNMELGFQQWWLILTLGVIAVGAVVVGLVGLATRARKYGTGGREKGVEKDVELDSVEQTLLRAIALNPTADSSPKSFVGFGISEEKAKQYLERLTSYGLLESRYARAGGGYDLTDRGKAYLNREERK